MSGGSYDYAYCKVADMADQLSHSGSNERKAFARLLRNVAQAMHDVEWVDSGDMCKGDESKAIQEALGGPASQLILDESVTSAKEALDDLKEAIERVIDESA